MIKPGTLIVLQLLIGISVADLFSQDNTDAHPWWVDIGAGPAIINSDLSMNAGMIYCYQLERTVISARIIGITNKNPTIQKYDPSRISYKTTDYGILYGPLWNSGDLFFSIGAGFGLIRTTYEASSEIYMYSGISVPVELQLFWRPFQFCGIGLYVYTSFNNREQISGSIVCAQLGIW